MSRKSPGQHLWGCHHLHQAFPLQAFHWKQSDFFKGQKWIKMLGLWSYDVIWCHMMSYDVICMAAFAGLWWFMLISCDINGWCIQILLVVGSTRYRITNSAPNGPAKRWSFWGVNKFDWCPQCVAWYSSYADTAYSHARRVDQTPRAPMDTDWLHPRLGKRKNEDEEVPHASQFSILSWTRIYWTPLMNTFDTRCETIGSSAFHCQDHRELCRMITMVVADEDRRGDASCSCLTWISIHNVFI